MFGSGSGTTTLIVSNEEMNDIIRIINSTEEFGLLIKGVHETIKNEAKERKGGFLWTLLRTLGASLLGNFLTGKSRIRAGEGTIRAGQSRLLMPRHPLSNFKIRKILSKWT